MRTVSTWPRRPCSARPVDRGPGAAEHCGTAARPDQPARPGRGNRPAPGGLPKPMDHSRHCGIRFAGPGELQAQGDPDTPVPHGHPVRQAPSQ
eukprot:763009-Hanusia_phi.AAC.2